MGYGPWCCQFSFRPTRSVGVWVPPRINVCNAGPWTYIAWVNDGRFSLWQSMRKDRFVFAKVYSMYRVATLNSRFLSNKQQHMAGFKPLLLQVFPRRDLINGLLLPNERCKRCAFEDCPFMVAFPSSSGVSIPTASIFVMDDRVGICWCLVFPSFWTLLSNHISSTHLKFHLATACNCWMLQSC